MTTFTKTIVSFAVVGAIAGILAFFGLTPFGKTIVQQTFGSPSGSTFGTAKIAAQVIQNPSATTTIYSMQNTDASIRMITEADAHLLGATGTTSSYTIQCATSSTQYFPPTATNFVLNWISTSTASSTGAGPFSTVGVGTTTGDGIYMASTSPGFAGVITAGQLASSTIRIWPASSYLVCQATKPGGDGVQNIFNATVTGFIGFKYFGE